MVTKGSISFKGDLVLGSVFTALVQGLVPVALGTGLDTNY